MSEYHATINWARKGDDFLDNKYSRIHDWQFDGGQTIRASASAQLVPEPWADGNLIDPEEAFVASIASCHMLFFLSLAAHRGWQVEEYQDRASGLLADRGDGKLAMTEVRLQPAVRFSPDTRPEAQQIEALHHAAHERCFIANSVQTRITVDSGRIK
jgi:organic hydroperoxide reductase OsmC/OhrA